MSITQNQIIIIVVAGSIFLALISWAVYKIKSSSSQPADQMSMEMQSQQPQGIVGGKRWKRLRRRFNKTRK
jgi:hypothetical protein